MTVDLRKTALADGGAARTVSAAVISQRRRGRRDQDQAEPEKFTSAPGAIVSS